MKDELLSKKWCDLIFDKRNKDYGAYLLRKTAGRRYAVAIFFALFIPLVIAFFPLGLSLYFKAQLKAGLEEMAKLNKLKKLEPEKGCEFKAIAASRLPHKSVKKSEKPMAAPVIADEVKKAFKFSCEGKKEIALPSDFVRDPIEDTAKVKLPENLPVAGPELLPTQVVEQMPMFPGGFAALAKFFDDNIIYPRSCIDDGEEGDVELSFLVDKNGDVIHLRITKSASSILDRAVMMAARRMPKWTPGKIKGKNAVVSVSIPVHFQAR